MALFVRPALAVIGLFAATLVADPLVDYIAKAFFAMRGDVAASTGWVGVLAQFNQFFWWFIAFGGLLLVWIAVKLMLPEDEEGHDIQSSEHLWGAVKTIVVADFVMSLDNVIAVAGAAHGSLALLLFGLAVSIPLIVWSSQLILHWMERFPSIVLFGAGLLGYVAGQMIFSDPGVMALLPPLPDGAAKVAGVVGAVLVVGVGRWLEQRMLARQDVTIV
jgi:YjbE family integral membrane protein